MSIDEMVDLTNIGTLFAFVLVCVGIIILRYKDPSRPRPFRVPFGTWLIPTLGAVSCIFLMYYLPPASWWRFIGWLMLGMSIYLSYGYVRSAVGQKLGRPFPTPMGLKIAAVGFLLLAVGLFIIPHSSSMAELYEKMMSGMDEGKRTILAFTSIGIGSLLAVAGLLFGSGNATSSE